MNNAQSPYTRWIKHNFWPDFAFWLFWWVVFVLFFFVFGFVFCFLLVLLSCFYFVYILFLFFYLFSTSPEVAIPCQVNDVQCIVAIWYRLVKQSGCNDLFSEKSRIQLSACSTPQQLVSVASAGVSHSMVWNQDSGWLFPYNIWLNSLN